MNRMISVQQAQEIIHRESRQLDAILIPIANALGYYTAKDILAPISLPPFNSSAMDGFAVNAAHGIDQFKVIGEIQAGSDAQFFLREGEAVRIFTGACVPSSANAVIMQELTAVNGELLDVEGEIQVGSNIRKAGEQIEKGNLAFGSETLITPAGIGFLASLGIEKVLVYDKPKIGLLVTGNELVKPGETLEKGQIYESNGLTLSAAIEDLGFEIREYSLVEDSFKSTKIEIDLKLNEVDVLIVSGGISVGEYDFVGKAMESLGVVEHFYKVKQKPGKPLFFGSKNNCLCFALPGNPASALSCFYNYVLPALRILSGSKSPFLESRKMTCANSFNRKGVRAQFLKALIKKDTVSILEGQGSAMLHSFAISNALVFLDEGSGNIIAGDTVKVICLP